MTLGAKSQKPKRVPEIQPKLKFHQHMALETDIQMRPSMCKCFHIKARSLKIKKEKLERLLLRKHITETSSTVNG